MKTSVVITTTHGEARPVGSGCLRDFLDGRDPERACRQAEFLALARGAVERADRPRAESTGAAAPELTLEQLAAHAAHLLLRLDGWVSRARAR